jgi:hypothetical protein
LALASLAKASGLLIQWGTMADWLAAFGSTLAAVVAVGIAIHGNNRHDRKEDAERQKAEDRARRRASRIQIRRVWRRPLESSTNELEVMLSNKGSTDLYEVQWFPPLLVQFAGEGDDTIESVTRAVGTTITDDRNRLETSDPETIAPGQNRRIFVPVVAQDDAADRTPLVVELITFVDADGYRLGRVYPPNTNPHSRRIAVPGWAVVDDDYPDSGSGFLGDLLKQIEG